MKVETRTFKHASYLLLLAENEEEARAIDLMLGDWLERPIKVEGELTCDDTFSPYLRFKRSDNAAQKRKDPPPVAKRHPKGREG